MLDDKQYLTYKKLKDDLNVVYKGYDLKYVMSKDIIFYTYNLYQAQITKASIIDSLFRAKDMRPFFDLLAFKKVIFTISIPGKDYTTLVENISNSIDNGVFFKEDNRQIPYKNVKVIFLSFIQIFFNVSFFNVSFKERFFFFLRLVSFKYIIDQLESYKGDVNTKAYVASFSGNMESLYCGFFQKKQIKTYCLQHGLHAPAVDYKCFIPADICSIENLNADYMLSWGDYMKEGLQKQGFSTDKYLLAGNPKYSAFGKIQVRNSSFKTGIVCLARDVYSTYNLQLLQIAAEMKRNGLVVYIKIHPRSDINLYNKLIAQNDLKLLDKTISIQQSIAELNPDFAVVYNSTVYYEYYINNLIAFRFGVYANDIPFGLNDEFSTMEELNQRIEAFKNRKTEELNTEINAVIGRFCALGVNNYAAILNNIQ